MSRITTPSRARRPAGRRLPAFVPAGLDAQDSAPGGFAGGAPSTPPPVRGPAGTLLTRTERCLRQATESETPAARFSLSYQAALRAAAAVAAARSGPRRCAARPTSAWVLLADAAPELADWADFFASGSGLREAAETGREYAISEGVADDELRQARRFAELAERMVRGEDLRCWS